MALKRLLTIIGITAIALLHLQCTTTVGKAPRAADAPCAAGEPDTGKAGTAAEASPHAERGPKTIWAQSYLYADAPELEVGEWIGKKPGDMKGKFVIVEFWRTWCGACKRMTPLMNMIHEKYGDDFVVIGITGENRAKVAAGWDGPEKKYHIAIDKPGPDPEKPEQGATEAKFGVWGWPHTVILEPQHRAVIWEGFPGLKGHELTEDKIRKMIAIKNGEKE